MSDGDFVRQRLDERVTAIVEAEQAPGVSFHLTGRQHIKAHTHAVMVHDLARLIPLAIAVGAVVAWLLSRSVLATVLPVGASVLATLWVYAVLAWLGRPLNLITVVLGPMLICVGSVYGVHVLARFEEFAAARDGGRGSALRCLEYCRTPVGIAATTTVIGFGALLTSPVPAIDELGTFAVLGIVSVTMISLAGIPSLLSAGTREHRAPVQNPYIEQVLSGLARLSTKRPGATLTV
jgi:predicted RND superfamily exporter protein